MSEGTGVVDNLVAKAGPAKPVLEKVVAKIRSMSSGARMAALFTLIGALTIGGFFAFHHAEPPYAPLFTNLDRDDAAVVVTKLKELKVPYRLQGDGSLIEVPEDKVRETRLELAGQGLPRGGNVGFESFDKMRLGATDFEQRILYRRALEGELSRTIGAIGAVESARIHLVLPEKSVFVSKNEPSSASVVLKLRGGRALGGGEVAGIVHLVATSVQGLSPDRVAVVTTEGQVLHRPRRAGEDGIGVDDDKESKARALEATLEERARAIVEKVTGAGHADVRVTADIDSARVEHVEDRYDPSRTALRSEESTIERTAGEEPPVAGVPGAESNLPNGSAAGAKAADGGAPEVAKGTLPTREQHTRNFEVDHVSEKRVVAGGVLKRLTVAVVIDGNRSKEELDKITGLVRSAVGFDERRGDAVTVEAVPFLVVAEPPAPPAPTTKLPIDLKNPLHVGPLAGGALLFLVLVALMVKRSRKKARAVSEALALVAAKEKASAEQVTVEILGKNEEENETSADDLKQLVRERALLDPSTAALIVKGWLGTASEAAGVREEAA
ncbi:MAG: flagellar M-ring protein FliF [Labilithrix sp.]|nr:flagellar M-ring protein FliF [Labilithrix sp.]MCW5817664.1 flagellar M-ring protein FliF [Labilithrix sp.]